MSSYAELAQSAARGAAQARVAGVVMGRQERKSARGARFAFVQLSDPTGLYEVTVFSDALAQSRDLLEAGSKVVLTVDAEAEGDHLKLIARAVQPIDAVTADAAAAGLRVFVAEERALASVQARLADAKAGNGKGRNGRRGGPVEIVVADPALGCEIEVALPGEWPVTPEVRGAIKAAPGVAHVEDF